MLNKRLPGFLRRTVTDDAAVEPADVIQVTNQRKDEEHVPATDGEKPAEELPTGDAQDGVKAIEAITLSWSKGSLVAVYVWYVVAACCRKTWAFANS